MHPTATPETHFSRLMLLAIIWGLLALLLGLADGFTVPFKAKFTPFLKDKARHGRGYSTKMAAQDEEGYLTWLSKKVERAQRPRFIQFARARLTKDFAVLLMRTSYQVRRSIQIFISCDGCCCRGHGCTGFWAGLLFYFFYTSLHPFTGTSRQ